MKYIVKRYFTDLQDNDYAYNVGDQFPREGKSVSQVRLDELSGFNNKQRVPLIEAVNEQPKEDDFSSYMNHPEFNRREYTKNDIVRMSKMSLVALAEDLGIEGAADKTGNTLRPLIMEKLGL